MIKPSKPFPFLDFRSLNPSVADTYVVQVREGGGSQSPYIEQLLAATKEAENGNKGLWSKVQHSHDAMLPFVFFSCFYVCVGGLGSLEVGGRYIHVCWGIGIPGRKAGGTNSSVK